MTHGPQLKPLQDAQGGQHRAATRARRGHGVERIAAISPDQRLPLTGAVPLQVGQCEEASGGGRRIHDRLGDGTGVKGRRSPLGDSAKRRRKTRPAQPVPLINHPATVAHKEAQDTGALLQRITHLAQPQGQDVTHLEALLGQAHCRLDDIFPGQAAVTTMELEESRHLTRNGDRQPRASAQLGLHLALYDEHVAVSRRGCHLAKVERDDTILGTIIDESESTTAYTRALRADDTQYQGRSYGGVGSASASLKYGQSGRTGSFRIGRDHPRSTSDGRLTRGLRGERKKE